MTTSSFSSNSPAVASSPSKSQEYMDSLIPPSRDQFEHIAHVQEEKEEEIRRRVKEQKRLSHQEHKDSLYSDRHAERDDAARVIQKTFRGYRARRELSGFILDPSTRWVTAIKEAQFRETTRPRGRSINCESQDTFSTGDSDESRHSTARMNWKKISMVARRAGHDDDEEESDDSSSDESLSLSLKEKEEREEIRKLRIEANAHRRETALTLGLQYWLEIVDQKHRYGTNLRMYHEEWRKADTNENFFYWLDYGEGRYISLDTCPREILERDQVRYLSREERQFYLVTVDDRGRLCWAKNCEPISTSQDYRDSLYGIVPVNDPSPSYRPMDRHNQDDESSSELNLDYLSVTGNKHEPHSTNKHPTSTEDHHMKKVKQLSATTALNKLLRKTVKDGTWIFVADTNFRLYVGIKQAGAFQHSSFLQGGRISAGGLIGIKEGKLTFLSPLSGHYRPPTSNFRAFVRSLKDEGVDVGHVPMSKAYAVLLGLETYTKTRRISKNLVGKLIHRKDKIIHPKEVQLKEEEEKDKSKSAEKERRILEKEKEVAEANRTAVRAMQKLHLVPPRADNEAEDHRAV